MQHLLTRSLAVSAAALSIASLTPTAFAHTVRSASAGHAAAATQYPGFVVNVFANGTSKLFNPDGIVVTKDAVFVDYQNASDTQSVPSTIVKYGRDGHLLGSVEILGRCDGLRLNPYTHKLWALVNNDGLNGSPPRQPALFVIDPGTLAAQRYAFATAKQPHGGGYDDMAFLHGRAFFSASSPTLNGKINDKPIVVEATLQTSVVTIRPILYGNAGGANVTDPDSMAVVGDQLVVVSEGDSQIVFVNQPGNGGQTSRVVPTGTNLDDVAEATGTSGTMYVADSALNRVYAIRATVPAGSVFAEAPASSGVRSFIGSLNLSTGTLTPYLTVRDGIVDPTALIFVRSGN